MTLGDPAADAALDQSIMSVRHALRQYGVDPTDPAQLRVAYGTVALLADLLSDNPSAGPVGFLAAFQLTLASLAATGDPPDAI